MFEILKQIYLNSIIYDKILTDKSISELRYKPSAHLQSSIVKIKTKKFNIHDFSHDDFWTNKMLNEKQLQKLNNFYWLFSLDLKSPSKSVQKIIKSWIEKNHKYNTKNWKFELTSKRIISLLSNMNLTYDNGEEQYQKDFNFIIHKQTLHLINQIEKEKCFNNRIISITLVYLI